MQHTPTRNVDGGLSVFRYGGPHEEQAFCTRAHIAPDVRSIIAGNNSRSRGAPCPDRGFRACSRGVVFTRSNRPPREVVSGKSWSNAMLHTVKELHDFTVGASDGEIGEVKDVYFDDERWAIRYMVVEAGGWLNGRKVLISPISVRDVDWVDEVANVKLSQQQVRD